MSRPRARERNFVTLIVGATLSGCDPDQTADGAHPLSLTAGDLNQVAARVVENSSVNRTHLQGRLGEVHAESCQSGVFCAHTVDGKLLERDAVLDQCLFERLNGWMLARLQEELGPVGLVGGDDREPGELTQRNVLALDEAKLVDIEVERLRLVLDEDAGDVDAHVQLPW